MFDSCSRLGRCSGVPLTDGDPESAIFQTKGYKIPKNWQKNATKLDLTRMGSQFLFGVALKSNRNLGDLAVAPRQTRREPLNSDAAHCLDDKRPIGCQPARCGGLQKRRVRGHSLARDYEGDGIRLVSLRRHSWFQAFRFRQTALAGAPSTIGPA